MLWPDLPHEAVGHSQALDVTGRSGLEVFRNGQLGDSTAFWKLCSFGSSGSGWQRGSRGVHNRDGVRSVSDSGRMTWHTGVDELFLVVAKHQILQGVQTTNQFCVLLLFFEFWELFNRSCPICLILRRNCWVLLSHWRNGLGCEDSCTANSNAIASWIMWNSTLVAINFLSVRASKKERPLRSCSQGLSRCLQFRMVFRSWNFQKARNFKRVKWAWVKNKGHWTLFFSSLRSKLYILGMAAVPNTRNNKHCCKLPYSSAHLDWSPPGHEGISEPVAPPCGHAACQHCLTLGSVPLPRYWIHLNSPFIGPQRE